MKQYQITRKLQVTIPKKIAERQGIRPGDSVVFEEAGDTITLKKVAESRHSSDEVKLIIQDFARDVTSIRKHVKEVETAIVENLSRHVSPE